MNARPRVLLLRAPDGTGPDRYITALDHAGFDAECAATLDITFENGEAVEAALAHPERFGGLVCSSRVAVEAIGRVGLPSSWQDKPTFVVGEATRQAAASLGLCAVGAESGSARALVDYIVARKDRVTPPALLFACGTRRLATIPERLPPRGIAVIECVAYATHLRTPKVDPQAFDAAVWFSPSGVDAVFGQRKTQLGEAREGEAQPGAARPEVASPVAWNSLRRVAIGPTTASALAEAGRPAHAVASAPRPSALADAIATLFP